MADFKKWLGSDSLRTLHEKYNFNLDETNSRINSVSSSVTSLTQSISSQLQSVNTKIGSIDKTYIEGKSNSADWQNGKMSISLSYATSGTRPNGLGHNNPMIINASYDSNWWNQLCLDFNGRIWIRGKDNNKNFVSPWRKVWTDEHFNYTPSRSRWTGSVSGINGVSDTSGNNYNTAGVWAGNSNEVIFTSSGSYIFFNHSTLGTNPVNTYYFKDGRGSNNGTIYCGTLNPSKVHNAVWNDYAEWFERGEPTEPGDIIALDEVCDKERYIKATENSTCVVGVHTDEYAFLIGGDELPTPTPNSEEAIPSAYDFNIDKYIPVGMMGRVRVKFIGEARKGMKVVPSKIAGVGKAYDPLTDNPDNIVGVIVENNTELEIRRIRIKLK